jgi:hypothetical protein
MGLDIRLPIGGLFLILGLLLAVYGLGSDHEIYQRSLGVNVNLWWGVLMSLFGLVMIVLGRRAGKIEGMHPASESAEGRAIEEREHRTGLERD